MWYRIACHGDRICLRVYLRRPAHTTVARQRYSNALPPGWHASIVPCQWMLCNELLGTPSPPTLL